MASAHAFCAARTSCSETGTGWGALVYAVTGVPIVTELVAAGAASVVAAGAVMYPGGAVCVAMTGPGPCGAAAVVIAGLVTYTGGAVNVAVTGAGPAAAYVAGAISVVAAGAVTYTGGAV